jgi:hypothetical protein
MLVKIYSSFGLKRLLPFMQLFYYGEEEEEEEESKAKQSYHGTC